MVLRATRAWKLIHRIENYIVISVQGSCRSQEWFRRHRVKKSSCNVGQLAIHTVDFIPLKEGGHRFLWLNVLFCLCSRSITFPLQDSCTDMQSSKSKFTSRALHCIFFSPPSLIREAFFSFFFFFFTLTRRPASHRLIRGEHREHYGTFRGCGSAEWKAEHSAVNKVFWSSYIGLGETGADETTGTHGGSQKLGTPVPLPLNSLAADRLWSTK